MATAQEILYTIKAQDQASQVFKNNQNAVLGMSKALTSQLNAMGDAAQGLIKYKQSLVDASNASEKAAANTREGALAFKELSSAVVVLDGPLGGVASRIRAIGTLFSSINPLIAAGALGFIALSAASIAGIKKFEDMETATLKLNAVLQATGKDVNGITEEILSFADKNSKETLFDDKDVLAAATMAASFKNIRTNEIIPLIETAENLATVTGRDLPSTMMALSRAMNAPDTALDSLRRQGASFTSQQKEMIKALVETGDITQAQADIMQKFAGTHGAAAAAAQGLQGDQHRLGQEFEDFGKLVAQDTAALAGYKDMVNLLTSALQGAGHWIDAEATTMGHTLLALEIGFNKVTLLAEKFPHFEASPGQTARDTAAAQDAIKQLEFIRDKTDELQGGGKSFGEAYAEATAQAAQGIYKLTDAEKALLVQQQNMVNMAKARNAAKTAPGNPYSDQQLKDAEQMFKGLETQAQQHADKVAEIQKLSEAAAEKALADHGIKLVAGQKAVNVMLEMENARYAAQQVKNEQKGINEALALIDRYQNQRQEMERTHQANLAQIQAMSATDIAGAMKKRGISGTDPETERQKLINDEMAKYNKLVDDANLADAKLKLTESQRLDIEIQAIGLMNQRRDLDKHQAEAQVELNMNLTAAQRKEIESEEKAYQLRKQMLDLNKDETTLRSLQDENAALQMVADGREKNLELAKLQVEYDLSTTTPAQREIIEQIKAQTEANEHLNQVLDAEKQLQEGITTAAEDTFKSIITGATSARDAVAKLLSKFADLAANAAFSGLNQSLSGGGTWGWISSLFGTSGGSAGGVGPGTGGLYAKGGVFFGGQEVQMFAKGGVVDGPTMFPMGMMGEKGHEAIMPLAKLSDGSLGIRATSGVGGQTTIHYAPVYTMTIPGNADGTAPSDKTVQNHAEFLRLADNHFKTMMVQMIQDQQRNGGILSQQMRV
jgi:phage-related minor tail protein